MRWMGSLLRFKKESLVALLGAHGAGKTTLCLSLNGIVPNMINADMVWSNRSIG